MEAASKQYYDNFLNFVVTGNPNSKKGYESAEKKMEELIMEAESSLSEYPHDLKKVHDISKVQVIRGQGQEQEPQFTWQYIALAGLGLTMIAMMFL
jgi:hypothetical protein